MVRIPKLFAVLLALAGLACTANVSGGGSRDQDGGSQDVGSWREVIHDEHLGSVLGAETRAAALNDSLPPGAYGLSDLPQVRELLGAPALTLRRADLPGEWRCRSLQVNRSGVFVYPFFHCRIYEAGRRLRFEKLTGSQRRSGELSEAGPDRFAFLGGATVNEDPQSAYSGTLGESSAPSDSAGVLTRKGENRLLMILDATADAYELYELRREGAAR